MKQCPDIEEIRQKVQLTLVGMREVKQGGPRPTLGGIPCGAGAPTEERGVWDLHWALQPGSPVQKRKNLITSSRENQ